MTSNARPARRSATLNISYCDDGDSSSKKRKSVDPLDVKQNMADAFSFLDPANKSNLKKTVPSSSHKTPHRAVIHEEKDAIKTFNLSKHVRLTKINNSNSSSKTDQQRNDKNSPVNVKRTDSQNQIPVKSGLDQVLKSNNLPGIKIKRIPEESIRKAVNIHPQTISNLESSAKAKVKSESPKIKKNRSISPKVLKTINSQSSMKVKEID